MSNASFVFSEVYTAGGTSAQGYNSDYVVIHNNTTTSQSLSGLRLRYSSATSSGFNFTYGFGNITVEAGRYFLIQLGTPSSTTGLQLPTPDLSVSLFNLSPQGGKIALTNSAFSGSGVASNQAGIVDYVGYGTANAYEGSGAAPAPAGTTRLVRADQGTVDSDDNASDLTVIGFGAGTSPPKNSSSAAYIVCFGPGTRIRTARGEVAVEALAVSDHAVTSGGAHRPIRWIGHRTLACHSEDVRPVRIAAEAFGEGRPTRDLLVSPAHAIAVDVLGEVLIPAGRLINGTTITQADVESITYWHVELDSHDLLLAEGLAAESYLDCGNRRFFANADLTDLAALPDARPEGPLPFCRPFHEDGPLVELVRARLEDRAQALGWNRVEETFAGLHLVADGRVIHPDVEGLTARFVLSTQARDVRLVSETSVPARVRPGSTAARRLGLALAQLTIDDGLTGARTIPLDDPRLGEGFHAPDGHLRWTDGSAVLPAELWAGCRGAAFLRVTLAAPALPRWVAPRIGADAQDDVRRNA